MVFDKKSGSGLAARALAVVGAVLVAVTAAVADGARPQADDKCVAQCDEQSDKCMLDASKDSQKQRACDSAYDECLRKCS